MSPDLMKQSPYGTFLEHVKKGELAYQVDTDNGKAVFYPRAIAPGSGNASLEWRVSKGLGTVYATTVVYSRNEAPFNVAMIDLDEGFRMMSRVEDMDPLQVKIGMRVKVRMHPGDDKQPPYPVFHPLLPEEGSPPSDSHRTNVRSGTSPLQSGERGGGGGSGGEPHHPGSSSHPSSERRGA